MYKKLNLLVLSVGRTIQQSHCSKINTTQANVLISELEVVVH